MNNGGGSIACAPCSNGLIQTLDGFDCILCDQTCLDCSKNKGYRVDLNQDGTPIFQPGGTTRRSECIKCDSINSIFAGSSCISCKPIIFVEATTPAIKDLSCINPLNPFIINGGLFIFPITVTGTLATDPNTFNLIFGSDSTILSSYLSENLLGVFRTCRSLTQRNSTACQTLGNMCALNIYVSDTDSAKIDACKAFISLQQSGTTTATNNVLFGQFMPWLFYLNTYGSFKRSYILTGTNDPSSQFIFLEFENKCTAKYLSFYAAQYRLNGSLISYDTIDISKFQLCNSLSSTFSEASQVNPFSATNYQQSCTVSGSSLYELGKNPIFYDVYLKYSTSSNLYPIPVIVGYESK